MPEVRINPRELRARILSRGVKLNPPASPDCLDALARWAGGRLDPELVAVLSEFDGFVEGYLDAPTLVSVWPVRKALADDWTKSPILAFADWSINALIFGFDPSGAGPIKSIEDGLVVAPTYADFWSQLLEDRLL